MDKDFEEIECICIINVDNFTYGKTYTVYSILDEVTFYPTTHKKLYVYVFDDTNIRRYTLREYFKPVIDFRDDQLNTILK